MTIEEAIKHFEAQAQCNYKPFREAAELAIAALRTQADTPPNDPLTPEEMREMDGEPVCITPAGGGKYVWVLVDEKYEVCRDAYGCLIVFEDLCKTWLAYRRRPEEGTT